MIWAIVVLLALGLDAGRVQFNRLIGLPLQQGQYRNISVQTGNVHYIGVAIIYFAHRVNYTLYSSGRSILFLIAIPLLIYTLFFGVRLNEGSRWIRLPIINLTFQTSDLAKLALFMYLSRLLSSKQDVIKDFKKGFCP